MNLVIIAIIFLSLNLVYGQENIENTETTKTENIEVNSEELNLIKQIENNPENKDLYLRIINYYNNQNRKKDKLKYVIKYIQKFGGSSDLYLIMGDDYKYIGDYNRSLISYQQALRIDPMNPNIYNRMGLTLLKLSYFNQAEAAFKAAIYFISKKDKPYDKSVYYNNLGSCYEAMKDYYNALKAFQLALKTYPDFEKARINIERIKEIIKTENIKQ